MDEQLKNVDGQSAGLLSKLIRFCLENKLVVALFVIMVVGWGIMVAPFDWDLWGLEKLNSLPEGLEKPA